MLQDLVRHRVLARQRHSVAAVSIPGTRQAGAEARPGDLARRPARIRAGDLLAVAALVVGAGVIEYFLRHLLTRPLYSDEAWRAYDIALGPGFLTRLNTSGAPLALGWVAIENVARVTLGDTEAGLRAPMFLGLPALAVATYLLARRWLGVGVSFCAAGLLLVNSWIVNNALQLKSYSYEGLLAIAAVALYLRLQRDGLRPARLLGLYALLGLTCVFSLPNLFVLAPLLALDFVRVLRGRHRVALRVAGQALAAVIALVHYVLFVRPQSGVANTGFWVVNYAPHGLGAFLRFTADGLGSYFPSMVTGVAGAENQLPSYTLPPAAHGLLAAALAVLLAAGIVAASRDGTGRVLVVTVGGALLLELIGSAVRRWPFGMARVNIFMLPLLYVLGAMGAVWLAHALLGRRGAHGVAWWRAVGAGAAAVVLALAGTAAGVATAKALAQTSRLQARPTMFGGLRAAVAQARLMAGRGDLVIIRADRTPPVWYADGWLYYMDSYQGWPEPVAARLPVPARDTISVVRVTPGAVEPFLAGHPRSPVVFLLEYNVPGNTFPRSLHLQSLRTLRGFGYCPARGFAYPITGHLTVLQACSRTGGLRLRLQDQDGVVPDPDGLHAGSGQITAPGPDLGRRLV